MNIDIPKNNNECDLIYKNAGEKSLSLAFLPPINNVYKKAPVYFIISGGGWQTMNNRGMIQFSKTSVDILRNNGFAVVSPEYRVTTQQNVGIIDCIEDCFDAIRYVAHWADILGIDNSKIALSGHSAGGHLALMLAYAPGHLFKSEHSLECEYKVSAVAPMSPPTVLFDGEYPETHLLDNMDDRFKPKNTHEFRKMASPVTYVAKDVPPTLLIAGTSDRLVFCNSSQILYDKLTQCGAQNCQLLLSGYGGHCFEKVDNQFEPTVSMGEVQQKISEFILKYGR